MKISKLSFNLLIVFDSLMSTRNVTRTSKILGVTQAAISESLSQLRKVFNDELFLRSRTHLIPTPLAESLINDIRTVITDAKNIFNQQVLFDPKKSTRVFKISMNSYCKTFMLPALLEDLKKSAPHIKLMIRSKSITHKIMLESGEIDCILLTHALQRDIEIPKEFISQEIHSDKINTCIGCKTNPLLKQNLTLKKFVSADHIACKLEDTSNFPTTVDNILKIENQKRNVIMTISEPALLPIFLLNSNLICLVSSKIADILTKTCALKKALAPISVDVNTLLIWHPKNRNDLGHAWLRDKIIEVAKKL